MSAVMILRTTILLIYKKRPAFDNVGLYGGDSRSRTDDPLLAKQML